MGEGAALLSFTYAPLPNPPKVIFGAGGIKSVPDELKRLHVSKPLIVSTKGQSHLAERVKALLAEKSITAAGVFAGAVMHTPVSVTGSAYDFFTSKDADAVISVGGGSSIGLGKAICFKHDTAKSAQIPHVCIPTTYAGSEMTPILGETEEGRKTTRSDPRILPAVVVYDVELTLSLPAAISATSGVNALAHAVEALYAQNSNPITSLLALEGVKALSSSLPALVHDVKDINARSQALYGAYMCGACLGSVGMALHHKLCHTLGGSFSLPHAETHTIVLPHALAYNMSAMPDDNMKKLAEALPDSNGDAANGLNALLKKLKVKRGLKELGMKEENVDEAADIATSNPYWNPRELDRDNIREVIRRAWAGEDARADI